MTPSMSADDDEEGEEEEEEAGPPLLPPPPAEASSSLALLARSTCSRQMPSTSASISGCPGLAPNTALLSSKAEEAVRPPFTTPAGVAAAAAAAPTFDTPAKNSARPHSASKPRRHCMSTSTYTPPNARRTS
jgi:hypothetical protein